MAPDHTGVSGGEAVIRALSEEGVELVFGIPGTHNLPLYRHLGATGIRHVTPRHEQGGGYAADGYFRAGGRPGVLLVTTGPGVTNAATPVATAWADSVPMLVIAPSLPTDVEGRDAGFLHQTKDQRGAMESLASSSHRATSPADAYRAVRDAFRRFACERPRPAHIEVPLDVLEAHEELGDPAPPASSIAPTLDADALEKAAALLAQDGRITFVLGGGARHAQESLTMLAERIGAAVLTTVNGKATVSEHHSLSLGASLRLRSAQAWLTESDVVLAVGTELGESDLWGPTPALAGKLIRVDLDEAQLDKNAPAAVGIAGDSERVVNALLELVSARPHRSPELHDVRKQLTDEALGDGGDWVELCAVLQRALGDDGVLAADSTMATYYGAVHMLRFGAPGRLLYPTGYATLGYGVPAGIGAKLACPETPVMVLSGDGGLMFTLAELVTAAELGLSLPIVVPNNGGYGEIRRQMRQADIEPIGVDLAVPDLPALASACGGRGKRLDRVAQLPAALDGALAHPGPTLIELPCRGS
ncbi:MAG: 5-guanidino-2-oxopentanoate decarboxylase [Thermoleophilaceae bacterium]|nr:5-guanidino-2-oxopentanoate decarboxylase [Thermoleophilaceae bacterium]